MVVNFGKPINQSIVLRVPIWLEKFTVRILEKMRTLLGNIDNIKHNMDDMIVHTNNSEDFKILFKYLSA